MTLSLVTEPVPLHVDPSGSVRVSNTRVTLDTVVQAFLEGATAEQIVQEYPVLELADVYAVLGYYLRRTDDVEKYLQERHEEARRVRKDVQDRSALQGIRARLNARRSQQGG